MRTTAPGLVPDSVGSGTDRVEVARAWPTTRVTEAGERVLAAEGTDASGRLRAARLRIAPAARGGWQVTGVTVAPAGRDDKLPDLADAARSGQVVVHRYGKRAVVRTVDRFVKVVRPGAAARIADQARRGRELALTGGFQAPMVLATTPGRVDFSALPGADLHRAGGHTPLGPWRAVWATWARCWPSLVGADGAGLAAHTAADEQVNLRRWTDQVARLAMLPEPLAATFAERVDRVCAWLGDGVGRPLGVAHRDLHDKQVLVHGNVLGLLDFDTAALAEPALDLANLLVHVRLRVAQGLWSPAHAEVAARQVLAVADALDVDPDRLACYAEATRLRLACLYLFRPRYRALALTWAARDGEDLPPISLLVEPEPAAARR